jgi:hypothetical protein
MRGVDVHNQLKLQRYSPQRSLRFRKYYKSLALGLIDLAIVNSYIVHKAYHTNKISKPSTYVKYMIKLHLQLTQLRAADMYEGKAEDLKSASVRHRMQRFQVAPTSNPSTRYGRLMNGAIGISKPRDVNERARSDLPCASTTSVRQRRCTSVVSAAVFLCMKDRRQVRGLTMTC